MTPIVTMVDINYLPGLIALFESIKQNANLPEDQKYIVIETEELSNKDRDLFKAFDLDIEFIGQQDYSDVCLDWFTGWQGLEWYSYIRKMLKKLYLFNMTEYEKIIFIDCDMICTGDLSELLHVEPFSARSDYAATQAMILGHPQFNTGLMVLSPSKEDFEGMIGLIREKPKEILSIVPSTDQVVINYYFWTNKPKAINMLPPKWGVSKRTIKVPGVFKEHIKDMRLLHFVGFKPWWGSDAPEYVELEKKWHSVWNQAKQRIAGGQINGSQSSKCSH